MQYLGALAAAYAEAGRFSEALQIAEEAIALAAVQNKAAPEDALRTRIMVHQAEPPRRKTPHSVQP